VDPRHIPAARLIPAGAGSTRPASALRPPSSAHPRGRGEHEPSGLRAGSTAA